MDNGPGLTQRKFPLAWQLLRQSYLTETYSDFGRAWVGTTQMPDSFTMSFALNLNSDFKAAETRHRRYAGTRGLVRAIRDMIHGSPFQDREALDSRVALYAAPAFHSNIRPVPGRSNRTGRGIQNGAARLAPADSAFARLVDCNPALLPRFPRFGRMQRPRLAIALVEAILLRPPSRSRPDKKPTPGAGNASDTAEATPLKRSTQHKRARHWRGATPFQWLGFRRRNDEPRNFLLSP